MPTLNEQTRAYIYRLVVAAMAVAVGYGLLEKEDVDVWLQVVTAVLGLLSAGLAAKNTSTNPATPKTVTDITYVGDILVGPGSEGKTLFSLELNGPPENLEKEKAVTFRVKQITDQPNHTGPLPRR